MKKRRISGLILSLLIVVLMIFTGCSDTSTSLGPNAPAISSSESESTLPQASEPSESETTLTNSDKSSESETALSTANESSSKDDNSDITQPESSQAIAQQTQPSISLSDIPAFNNSPYVAINGNVPFFSSSDFTTTSFENYSNLDNLGRCGVAYACVGMDIMPTEERGSIGSVKPTGWHTIKYDNVDGKYLYNRCHLIGYQLSGENANTKNLITGTRYLNVDGMLPFENMVADYVKETNNHVLYRVTPIFDGNNLVASGVLMEAESVEDNGSGILFCVYCYNNQPGVTISYLDGESTSTDNAIIDDAAEVTENTQSEGVEATYILNTNTKKFHKPECASTNKIKDSNKQTYTGSRDDLISQGYEPCKNCNP